MATPNSAAALPSEPEDDAEEIDALGWIYKMARQDARAKRERDSAPPTHPPVRVTGRGQRAKGRPHD